MNRAKCCYKLKGLPVNETKQCNSVLCTMERSFIFFKKRYVLHKAKIRPENNQKYHRILLLN